MDWVASHSLSFGEVKKKMKIATLNLMLFNSCSGSLSKSLGM